MLRDGARSVPAVSVPNKARATFSIVWSLP
ncbi:MAG: hypothetical protein K0S81_1430, partial [Rhodospirillales bacterium]|nr:hypothetical protein [Rhodospirillales bacterium]